MLDDGPVVEAWRFVKEGLDRIQGGLEAPVAGDVDVDLAPLFPRGSHLVHQPVGVGHPRSYVAVDEARLSQLAQLRHERAVGEELRCV